MNDQEIFCRIDHTLLCADSSESEIDALCEEALKYHTASACIPPSYVRHAHEKFPELNICTVIGFPLGYSTTAVKCFEAHEAVENGACEIDMVINLGYVRNGRFDDITSEIAKVKKACNGKVLKVIVETCALTKEDKIKLCKCVSDSGADYIKTSTGFGASGAKISDIKLFKEHIRHGVKIKASGGIKTRENLEAFINEGCDRIGTSSAVRLLTGGEGK